MDDGIGERSPDRRVVKLFDAGEPRFDAGIAVQHDVVRVDLEVVFARCGIELLCDILLIKEAEAQSLEMKREAIEQSKQEVARLIVLGMERMKVEKSR